MALVMIVMLLPITLSTATVDLTTPVSDEFGLLVTLLTDSAGHKGFLVTLVVFTLLILKLPLQRKAFLSKGIQLGVILLIGFASKTALKELTESPRPYTEYLSQASIVDAAERFYHLSTSQRVEAIEQVSKQVSSWRILHWQGEKDYSFPSGHTIFVAICMAFYGGIFLQFRRWGSLTLLLVWAGGVSFSRLWIGMHRPEDLFASTAFVAVVYFIVPQFENLGMLLAKRWPKSWPFCLIPDQNIHE
ncbi:phosphatase PAP2 family protein [Vibrio sp. FNV 38]|nr:phosphatase PAP2 family protein [Vibrio sp. FNV 38]